VIEGLSDAFLAYRVKDHRSISGCYSPAVFMFLAAESRADVLDHIKETIFSELDDQENRCTAQRLDALTNWKGPEVNEFLGDLITELERDGLRWDGPAKSPAERRKREILRGVYEVLGLRGDSRGLPILHSFLEVLPASRDSEKTRKSLTVFYGKDYGPFRDDWPPVEEAPNGS